MTSTDPSSDEPGSGCGRRGHQVFGVDDLRRWGRRLGGRVGKGVGLDSRSMRAGADARSTSVMLSVSTTSLIGTVSARLRCAALPRNWLVRVLCAASQRYGESAMRRCGLLRHARRKVSLARSSANQARVDRRKKRRMRGWSVDHSAV